MASSLSMPISTFDILAEGKQSLEIANDRVNQILDKVGDIFKEKHMKQSLPKHSIAKIVRVETLMISVSIILSSNSISGQRNESRFGWCEHRTKIR